MSGGLATRRAVWRAGLVITALLGALLAAALPAALATAGPAPALRPPDFPDPFILPADGRYFAFSTNAFGNVPLLTSPDLVHWEPVGDALPVLGRWAVPGRTWAPGVLYRWPLFVLFYTAQDRGTGRQCIGRAIAKVPQGPYVDPFDLPLVCQVRRGGSIDASPFVDHDLRPYLYWKSEGTVPGEPSRLWGQQLSDDGLHLVGRGAELARADRAWEGGIVEAPSMARHDGRYWFFYSGNRWDSPSYAVGWASCAGPLGPCTKAARPLLRSGPAGTGPGGQEAFHDHAGRLRLAYHAWAAGRPAAYPAGSRSLRLHTLDTRSGVPLPTW